MKNALNIAFIAIFFVVVGCKPSEESKSNALPFEVEERTFEFIDEGYSRVEVRYQHIVSGDNEVYAYIDEMNYAHTFGEYAVEPMNVKLVVENIAQQFSEIARDLMMEGGCEFYSLIDQTLSGVRNNSILCIETYVETYTGGAHQHYSLYYECYDLATGRLYDFSYLLDGESGPSMRELIYSTILQSHDTILFIDEEEITIPASVRVTESGLVLVYQPYEIAPFGEGIISVELSDEQIAATGAELLWTE